MINQRHRPEADDQVPHNAERRNIERLMLSPFYHHAVNSVTKPNKYVFCSQYFVDRWMPLLGGVGTQIVLFLRRQGFHNRVTGELRDEIEVEVSDIAEGVGSSPRTVQYHLAENEALLQFVRKRERFETDPRSRDGKRRQCANGFQIAMDDPVRGEDMAEVEAYILEQNPMLQSDGDKMQTFSQTIVDDEDANEDPMDTKQAQGNQPMKYPVQKLQGDGGAKIAGRNPGAKSAPTRCKNCGPNRELNTKNQDTLLPFNVGEGSTFVAASESDTSGKIVTPRIRSKRTQALDKLVEGLVAELHDFGSERRHYQLLNICQQRNLDELPRQALAATHRRMASESTQGPLEKPGAYYQRILLALLEDHQVFVPKLGEPSAEEVHRLALQSLKDAESAKDAGKVSETGPEAAG